MNDSRRAIVPCLLLVAAMSPVLGVGCGAKVEKSASASIGPKPVMVTLAEVETRPLERGVVAVGTIKGWEEVTVGAKRMGRVAKVRHDIGDRIKPGEMLVEFETVDADLSVDQAEKQLLAELAKVGVILKAVPTQTPSMDEINIYKLPTVVQAQVSLDRANQHLAREKNLVAKNAGMMQDFQNAENDVRNAQAMLDNAVLTARSTIVGAIASKVGLDVRRQSRLDMEIRAPIPSKPPFGLTEPVGYAVTKRSVAEGQMIREGDPVFDLVVDNPLRLWLNVPERYASEIKMGQDVKIGVSSQPNQAFEGKVSRINPMIDSTSRTFQVEAIIPNDEGKLRPGGFAKAQIITEHSTGSNVVPLDAIVRFAGVTKVFVVGDDNKARSVVVETGKEGPGWVEVLGSLPEKAKVVTTGQVLLADDAPVIVRKPEK